jgi:hypothetical protein
MNTKSNANVRKSTKKSAPAQAPVATPPSPAAAPSPAVPPIDSTAIAQCNSLLDQVSILIGPVTELSASDIKQSLKLRKGGAQVVTALSALCQHHGVTAVGPVTVAGMTAEMERANALNEIGVKFSAVQKELTDAAFSAESTCWQYATALYTVLQRLAVMDATLAAGLAPVQAFFQTKKTKGTRRDAAVAKKVKAAAKAVAKHPSPTAETQSPPAPVNPAPAATAATSGTNGVNLTNGPAPVASPAPAANGVAHS